MEKSEKIRILDDFMMESHHVNVVIKNIQDDIRRYAIDKKDLADEKYLKIDVCSGEIREAIKKMEADRFKE